MVLSEAEWTRLKTDRTALNEWQTQRLRTLVEYLETRNAFWTKRFAKLGFSAQSLRDLDDLRCLPLLTKAELEADQSGAPPYGTNLSCPVEVYTRLHQTSGTTTGIPLRWLDTPQNWAWMLNCWTQIFRLIGLRTSDRLCFPFSFGPFLGFWAGFEGAVNSGHFCLAAGGMSTESRLELIHHNRISVVGCTPSYALRLAEIAKSRAFDLPGSPVRALLVAGEPGGSLSAMRERIQNAWGSRVFDHWGMTEVGPLAIETFDQPASLTMLETECIPEVINQKTGEPVQAGEIGELVVTNLGRLDSPVIRYRTGDLVRLGLLQENRSGTCWMTFPGGILERADDMLIIRGNNVFPSTIESLIRESGDVIEHRIVVTEARAMSHVQIEIEINSSSQRNTQDVCQEVANRIKERLQFHADVISVAVGSLPRSEMKARRFVRRTSELPPAIQTDNHL